MVVMLFWVGGACRSTGVQAIVARLPLSSFTMKFDPLASSQLHGHDSKCLKRPYVSCHLSLFVDAFCVAYSLYVASAGSSCSSASSASWCDDAGRDIEYGVGSSLRC